MSENGGPVVDLHPGTDDETIEVLRSLPLEHALRHTAVGLAACDREGRLTLVTPVLQEILGRRFEAVDELDYASAFDLLDDAGQPLPTELIPLVRARGGETVRDELVVARRPDGALVHLRCNAAPFEDERADISGAVVFVQDVTAEVVARQRAEDERRLLLERVHHEIRTPLTTLLGYTELLHELDPETRPELPDQVQAALRAIDRAGDRLRDLLAQLGEATV